MNVTPVVARALANHAIDEIIAYYLGESAEQAASGFIDALEDAYAHIGRHPVIGSPRYAHEFNGNAAKRVAVAPSRRMTLNV